MLVRNSLMKSDMRQLCARAQHETVTIIRTLAIIVSHRKPICAGYAPGLQTSESFCENISMCKRSPKQIIKKVVRWDKLPIELQRRLLRGTRYAPVMRQAYKHQGLRSPFRHPPKPYCDCV